MHKAHPPMTSPPLTPGFLALHGNCAETLAQALIDWSSAHPLGPLEQEVVLVQSNGTAEWFKMLQAQHQGICAATRVELPARFLWRSWRQILGPQRVPSLSPLDEQPMAWRLMRLLPTCLELPAFAPIARFLRDDQPQRLLQLASRLADLFDQYQVYRSDWLLAWEAGRDHLPGLPGQPDTPLPEGQEWQPPLWRAVLADLTAQERSVTRPALRQQVLDALRTADIGSLPIARRVLLLGLTQVPLEMLEFLQAIARHSQVILAVPNPCRYHWADAIDGRELLRQQRRRHPNRGQDLATVSLEAMHAHAHPLLMAWGRQSRDYVRLLDDLESSTRLAQAISRIDIYDEAPNDKGSLLEQVQRSIRDLLPLAEHPKATQPQHCIAAADQSIVLHSAHSLVRELEVLHDHLLTLLAAPPPAGQAPLQPRNIIVMLPDIAAAAPAIRAVFGLHAHNDPRRIPFAIADLAAQAHSPLVVALQWLLRLPQQRCHFSDLASLLDVPAVAARLGLDPADAPQLRHWMAQAGIRWGLNAEHRRQLDLAACGDTNSAWFGLQRMLLGYASGAAPIEHDGLPTCADWQGMAPLPEVEGLSAHLAGILAALLACLQTWWQAAQTPAPPQVWAQRLRQLLADGFSAQDSVDAAVLQGLEHSLQTWLQACEHARFEQAVPLEVVQAAWLAALQAPALEERFHAGGVTFCTLQPMRAIPFEVVCLLGMNDGDYPRRASKNGFDLMQHPGQTRPGDRARNDYDRQLMLDALLSARRQLYLSWAGHSVRDNSPQPPSVLVAQLRDYLAAGWQGEDPAQPGRPGGDVVAQRSFHHPLQPFSRRYFEVGSPLTTYAREWQAAHQGANAPAPAPSPSPAPTAATATTPAPASTLPALNLPTLARFMRHPARSFLRQQWQVSFELAEDLPLDEECFALGGLAAYGLVEQLQTTMAAATPAWASAPPTSQALSTLLTHQLQHLQNAGSLPLAGLGEQEKAALHASTSSSLQAWAQLQQRYPVEAPHQALHLAHQGIVLDDWLDGLRQRHAAAPPVRISLSASKVLLGEGNKAQPRADKLLTPYLHSLAAAACGIALEQWLIGHDACLHIAATDPAEATSALHAWLATWQAGQAQPLPLPCKTALAQATNGKPWETYDGSHHSDGEATDLAWARFFPDFAALSADGRFAHYVEALYAPLVAWVAQSVQVIAWEQLEEACCSTLNHKTGGTTPAQT